MIGHLDLVLSLQVGHAFGADAVDGDDDVALDKVAQCRLTARSNLCEHKDSQSCRRVRVALQSHCADPRSAHTSLCIFTSLHHEKLTGKTESFP